MAISPASKAPNGSAETANRFDNTTLAAQFGIMPMMTASNGVRGLAEFKKFTKLSVPTKWMIVLIIRLIARIKANI